MNIEEATLGRRVRTLRTWPDVPEGTEGIICEDYKTGITVAWDLPHRPIPKNKTLAEIGDMWAIGDGCPLRDGFNKEEELQFLEVV